MVFGVGQFNYVSRIWRGHTLVAMATKICAFQHRICYNSACAGDTPHMLAPTRGFSGSSLQTVSAKLYSGDPCWHGNKKLEIFTRKFVNFGCITGWTVVQALCYRRQVFPMGVCDFLGFFTNRPGFDTPRKVKVVTKICLGPNISKTAGEESVTMERL